VGKLSEYREILERIGRGSTVSRDFALEIIEVAEAELAAATQEYTVGRATEVAGRSRSWVVRRLAAWADSGLARQLDDGTWLVKDAALPRRAHVPGGGIDLSSPVGSFADNLLKRTRSPGVRPVVSTRIRKGL
jgi:hypothetical protein